MTRRSAVRSAALVALLAAAIALGATACRYSLNGGGLPTDIRSVAIIPFDNETPSAELQHELNEALRSNFASKLGLKEAAEDKASAVVRGRIVSYELDVSTGFSANPAAATSSRRQLQVKVHVEIFDQLHNHTLWSGDLAALGDYPEGGEATGRKQAIEKIVTDVIQGAQSNW